MLTLFEVMTTEGWLDVRDMFDSVQDGDVSDTVHKRATNLAILIKQFFFFFSCST